jgi:4-hydroxyproline epimerase
MVRLDVVDSHTAGEPTRLVIGGGPDLSGHDPVSARRFLAAEDRWRRAVVCEPRGHDVMVGAWLLPPTREDCVAGVVFFNNVGYLGMCGHGLIGVVESLRQLGRIETGDYGIETPVGVIRVRLHADRRVTIRNVPSFRHAAGVEVEIEDGRLVRGDVAWGGNWFFLVEDHGLNLDLAHLDQALDLTRRIRRALDRSAIRGRDEAVVDHVELVSASNAEGVDARNFVLCPGLAWDRSPCGTGVSAKLACLAADGRLAAREEWCVESLSGGRFSARFEHGESEEVIVEVSGRAHVLGETRLLFDADDALAWGFA